MTNKTLHQLIVEYTEDYYTLFNASMQLKDKEPWQDLTKYAKTLERLTMLIEGLNSIISQRR